MNDVNVYLHYVSLQRGEGSPGKKKKKKKAFHTKVSGLGMGSMTGRLYEKIVWERGCSVLDKVVLTDSSAT